VMAGGAVTKESAARIVLFKMREKFSVRQVLEARCVVRHDVDLSREEVGQQATPVASLVGTGPVAQAGGGSVGGHHAFVHSRHCGCVVGAVEDGAVANFVIIGYDSCLACHGGMFQVAVGDGAIRHRCGWP
jgi:hypothetical protein